MKIIIFSDSHKNFNSMHLAMEKEAPIDYIIHLGDVSRDAEDMEHAYPYIPIAAVRGNNDCFDHSLPDDRLFTLGGVKIFITHGHNYGVKYTYAKLLKKAAELGADIAMFGHTHRAYSETYGDVTLFNPGASAKSYGVLEISDNGYKLEIRENLR